MHITARRADAVKGFVRAVAVLAAILAMPWALLLVLGASLQSGEGASAPGAVGIAVMAAAGLGCFIAGAVTSHSAPPFVRALARLVVGGLLAGGSALLETL